jgi:PAS domain S-box-containing protein
MAYVALLSGADTPPPDDELDPTDGSEAAALRDSLIDLGSLKVDAEAFLAATLLAAAQPMLVVDAAGLIRFANRAAVAALGYDGAHELVGRDGHETIHYMRPDGSPGWSSPECPMLRAQTTGEPVTSDLDWFVRRDGSMFAVSYVSVPFDIPDGRGAVVAFTDIEARPRAEQVLREHEAALAEEQASLRRVAVLAAGGASSAEVFSAVAAEVAVVLHLPLIAMYRYDPAGTATVVGSSGDHPFQPGTTWPLDGPTLASVVRRTGRPARIEDYADVPGTVGEAANRAGFTAGVGAPIVVDSDLWGVVCAFTDRPQPLPSDAESRLGQFTALVATAVSNSQAREDLRWLADEQAALRRVATLVAEGATPAEVFAAVAREVGLVLRLPLAGMFRYEADGTATAIGAMGDHPFQPGTTWSLDGPSMTAVVRRTGRTTRVEDYGQIPGTIGEASRVAGFQTGVAAPVVVDGGVWGVVCAGAADPHVPVPPNAERRLSQFTALVATAISNTQAREDLRRLVIEQAALRRLATLVAQGAEPRVVFDAVCEETGRVFGATSINLAHFTSDGFNLTMAGWSVRDVHVPAGTRLRLDCDNVSTLVRDTAAPARVESYEGAAGELAELIRELGIRSEVGAPVVVEGRVWGALIAASHGPNALPGGTERRLASFADLIATAVSNAAARSELLDSRVRIVEAADEQRRRVVRDLHDGAQSRLIHTVIALERARARDDVPPTVRPLVEEGLTHAHAAISELRDLAHGIHPVILTNNGLAAAVEVLADRTPLRVELEIPDERYPTPVESAAYFVAAEALTNVAKYAHASWARITVTRTPPGVRLVVEDDGVGGAQRAAGGGLAGLGDRLAALDGDLAVDSPPGGGTRIRAEIPLRASA